MGVCVLCFSKFYCKKYIVNEETILILLYPGSFDPVTYGHIDIALRGAKLADKLIIAVLKNPNKKEMFSLEERIDFLNEMFSDYKNIEIASFSGLLVQFATMQKADAILRGVRNSSDFDHEYQYAVYNRMLCVRDIDTIFIPSTLEFSHISSSAVKEMAQYMHEFPNENILEDFVPPPVVDAFKEKYKK
jgi:pantetheine-phosphate adenylyltransferase